MLGDNFPPGQDLLYIADLVGFSTFDLFFQQFQGMSDWNSVHFDDGNIFDLFDIHNFVFGKYFWCFIRPRLPE